MKRREAPNLQALLGELREICPHEDRVSVDAVQKALGRRAFGPTLLIAALPSMTPIATVPALPLVLSIIILFVAGQMLFGRTSFWLPRAMLERSIGRATFQRMIDIVMPAARFVDRLIKPRLHAATVPPFPRLIAACCCALALVKMPLEFVPFTSGIPAFPVAVFGLALLAQDGVLVVAGFVATVLALALLALIAFFGVTVLQHLWGAVF